MAVPPHVVINKSFSLQDNHSDSLARAVLHPTKYYLHEFFDDTAPFKATMHIGSKRFKRMGELATAAADAVALVEEEVEAQVVKTSDRVTAPVAKKRAAANLEKAREKLAESKAKRSRTRTMQLTGVAQLVPLPSPAGEAAAGPLVEVSATAS